MAWKVNVHINGFGKVSVKVPKRHTQTQFADAVADAVNQTLQLVWPNPVDRFHPVLGKGGDDWDHKAQRARVREAQAPSISVGVPSRKLRVHLRRMFDKILRREGGVQGGVDS